MSIEVLDPQSVHPVHPVNIVLHDGPFLAGCPMPGQPLLLSTSPAPDCSQFGIPFHDLPHAF